MLLKSADYILDTPGLHVWPQRVLYPMWPREAKKVEHPRIHTEAFHAWDLNMHILKIAKKNMYLQTL